MNCQVKKISLSCFFVLLFSVNVFGVDNMDSANVLYKDEVKYGIRDFTVGKEGVLSYCEHRQERG